MGNRGRAYGGVCIFPLGHSRPSKECFQPLGPPAVAASRPLFTLGASHEGLIVELDNLSLFSL